MSIRVRLAVALVIALTPVLALGVLEALNGFRYDAQVRRILLVQAAERSALKARAQVAAAQTLLESVTPQTVGLECTPRLAALADRLSGYTNLVRLDRDARVECAARDIKSSPEERQTRDWFRRLKGGEHFVLSRALRQDKPNIIAALRVDGRDGRFDGVMVAVIPLAGLQPDPRDPGLPAATSVALTDGGGRLLLQSASQGYAPPPAGLETMIRQHDGIYETTSGEQRLTHVAAPLLEDGSVYVVLTAPKPGLASWARLNPLTVLALPLLAFATAWATVWIVTDRVVVRWLRYLDRIANLYARGRFSVRPVQAQAGPAEIRALAQSLDVMADGIVARDLSLRENMAQKDALMREIHHRVKNNLQVITSLLNMQQRALTDPAARAAMYDTRQRITALALIYRALYQSPDLRRVDVRQFLEELIAQQAQGDHRAGPLRTELEADDLEIDPDKLAPLALFAVEAITQARKAVGEGGAEIRVRFAVGASEVVLEIGDQSADPALTDPGDVGRTLMTAYARQLRGRSEVLPAPGGGRMVRLIFPAPEPPASEPSVALVTDAGNQAAA